MVINYINGSSELDSLNEMVVNIKDPLPPSIENSVYYPKLKQVLFPEINSFCKEKIELKQELNVLRTLVGEQLEEKDIRQYLDNLKNKYNNKDTDIGIDYHIEATRIDFGVPVFVVIKRNTINMRKFVFRFRRNIGTAQNVDNLSSIGVPLFEME